MTTHDSDLLQWKGTEKNQQREEVHGVKVQKKPQVKDNRNLNGTFPTKSSNHNLIGSILISSKNNITSL